MGSAAVIFCQEVHLFLITSNPPLISEPAIHKEEVTRIFEVTVYAVCL